METSPFKVLITLFVFEIFLVTLFSGVVPNNPFTELITNTPPSYSGNWWDAPFYAFSLLFWAFQKPFALFGLMFYIMFFSGIEIITYSQIFIIGLLVIVFIYYIRGTQ